jgi:hypothetical protein
MCGWPINSLTLVATKVSYGIGIQWKSVFCPHLIHLAWCVGACWFYYSGQMKRKRKMKVTCWNCPTLGLNSTLHSWLFDHICLVSEHHMTFGVIKLLQCWNNFKGGSLKLYCSHTSNSSNLFGLCALCTESTKSVHYIPYRNQDRSPNLRGFQVLN